MKKILSLLFIFSNSILLFSQGYNISGTVKDTNGMPLVGVNVELIGSTYGAATNYEGEYKILNVKPGKYKIEFSSIGYKSIVITNQVIKNKSIIVDAILHQTSVESGLVVVTASKYAQKISDLPVSASIINSNELEKRDITDLENAMRFVPGVNMVDDQISIRGSSGYSRGAGTRVLLEIDGIPYYTGDTGEIIWEIVPVSEIQRVEVIKGAASSLYGSSAIGGVVNIITKGISTKPHTYVKMNIGTYDKPSYSIWDWSKELRTFSGLTVSHSDRIGKFGFALSLTRLSDMSYKQSGFYTRYIGYFKGMYNFSPVSSLTFFANSLNQDHGNFIYWKDSRNALVPPNADQGQRVNSNRYMFGGIYKQILNDNLFMNIKASYYRSDWWDQTSSFDTSLSNLFRLEIQTNANLAKDLILVSGIEASTDNIKSNIFNNQSSFGYGIYSQADYKFKFPLSVTLGARYDYSKLSSKIGVNAFSPKAGLNYKLTNKIVLRSSFGTGFRAPTLAEAFTSTSASGITIKPNPNLKPETNWTLELGVNYQAADNINLDAAIFQNEFKNFIEPSVNPKDGLVYFDNVTRARIQGLELNTNYSFLKNKLKFSLNYTYLWTRDLQQNTPLKYRPRHMAYANLDYSFLNFSIGADYRYSSKVEQIDYELIKLGVIKDGNKRVEIKVLDLRAGYKLKILSIPAKINFNVNNVFNYNYVELIGNLAPIRNYILSLELLF
jgi:outer membrane receptor for ferrienterochelin and colicins